MTMYNTTHEKIINAYLLALDAGDLDNQDALLAKVMEMTEDEGGAQLAAVLWEIQLAVGAELQNQDAAALIASQQADAGQVVAIAQSSFDTPVAPTLAGVTAMQEALAAADEAASLEDPPPPTLGDAAARLRAGLKGTPARVASLLRELAVLLDSRYGHVLIEKEHLSERGAIGLLARIGFNQLTAQVKKRFQETLMSLSVSHENELRLTAARRTRARRATLASPPAPASAAPEPEPVDLSGENSEDPAS